MKTRQINRDQLDILAVNYAKSFIGYNEISAEAFVAANLAPGFRATPVDLLMIAELAAKIVKEFGPEYQLKALIEANKLSYS